MISSKKMKTINNILAGAFAALTLVSCGGGNNSTAGSTSEVTPNVSITTAIVQTVSVDETYATTLQAYAVNNIAPQTSGRIIKINAEIGDYVKKGDVLAEMDKTNLEQAELQMKNAESEYERGKTLHEKGGLSDSDFETLEMTYKVRKSAYENLRDNTVLESPLEGVVSARNYDEGDMYSMSSPLYIVQQINPLKALVAVSESDYSLLKNGERVEISTDALPGKTFEGKVARIYPTIDATTHTVTAEVHVPNKDRVLRPGMYAAAKVIFGSESRIVLPDAAIVKQQGSAVRYVYVLDKNNVTSIKNVTVGRHNGSSYEILSGVEEGDRVVTSGQSALKSGIKVNVVE